jgi:uncharacterized protein (DUF433 family)
MSLKVDRVWDEIAERLIEATAAQLVVTIDPDIRGGEPVVRGTRIPVHMLHDLWKQGVGEDELLADCPSLNQQYLQLALRYAELHPRTGRPKNRPWQRVLDE